MAGWLPPHYFGTDGNRINPNLIIGLTMLLVLATDLVITLATDHLSHGQAETYLTRLCLLFPLF